MVLLAACDNSTYRVTLFAQPAAGGTVEGSGVYQPGDTVRISAEAAQGYVFANWSDGSNLNLRQFRATSDVMLTAYFEYEGGNVQPNPDMMVTFDGQVWYGTAVLSTSFTSFGYPLLQLQVVQTGLGESLPMAGLNIPLCTGPYTSHGDTVYSCFYMEQGSGDTVVYKGQTFPHWIALATTDTVCCTGTVASIDTINHTVSLTMKARMLDMKRFAASGESDIRTMSIRLENIQYEPQAMALMARPIRQRAF